MIKIKRPTDGPTVPDAGGICKLVTETDNNNAAYDLNAARFNSGDETFVFDSKIYGHFNIKDALRRYQNGKCAFCEQNVSSVAYGDIEHFRPKKGYCQNKKEKLKYPGYYWLAYSWNGLFFSCEICNQRYKKNYFPLVNPELRALNHHSDIKAEKPFFINPFLENPKFLIGFRGNVAYGKDKRHRGKKTIEYLGLNRKGDGFSDLFELRQDYLDIVANTYKISKAIADVSITQPEIDEAQLLMNALRNKKRQFSSMVQDNFPV
jgi:uncharacterized protein (TIGR02646 family)